MADVTTRKEVEATGEDLVVVVSLVRTLTATFSSASKVYRQLSKSKGLRGRIDSIKHHIGEHIRDDSTATNADSDSDSDNPRRRRRRDSQSDSDRGSRHRSSRRESPSRSRSRKRRDESTDNDARSIESSSALVRAEYDRGYKALGEKFAIGDLITRNHLQHQIIILQQLLLTIYEDTLLDTSTPHHPPSYHLRQLVRTAHAARTAAIDALAQQYKRMRPDPDPEPHKPHPTLPGSFPPASPIGKPHHHDASDPHGHGHSHSRPRPSPPSDLYCVYARDLQRSHFLPLSSNFNPAGDHQCPYCHAHIAARFSKFWEVVKEADEGRELLRTFYVGTRFLVKCHRQGGGFACVLCSEYRDADTVCGEVRGLVEHLWREHSCAELEWDDDIEESL